MIGTIILWMLAIIGVLVLLLWVYAWFITPEKKIEQEKNKRKPRKKRNKNK